MDVSGQSAVHWIALEGVGRVRVKDVGGKVTRDCICGVQDEKGRRVSSRLQKRRVIEVLRTDSKREARQGCVCNTLKRRRRQLPYAVLVIKLRASRVWAREREYWIEIIDKRRAKGKLTRCGSVWCRPQKGKALVPRYMDDNFPSLQRTLTRCRWGVTSTDRKTVPPRDRLAK